MENSQLKFVIVGHIDHGKSTLIGRLLYDTDSIAREKKEEIKNVSEGLGKETEFAYLLDHLEEERQQGITIDTTQVFFKTPKREYVIIDAPGHVEFVKNMITGASQAEAALLIVDAKEGVKEQTKRHSYILSLLGLEQVIVLINKMDLVNYEEKVFAKIKEDISAFLSSINIKPLFTIPISAIKGENVVKRSDKMKWYSGAAVLESLDSLKNRSLAQNAPLIFPVQDVYKIGDRRIAVGRVEAGSVNKNDDIKILPHGTKAKVKSVEKFLENVNASVTGESIGITTEDAVFINRGDVVCRADKEPDLKDTFRANIFWMSKKSFGKNSRLSLKCATQEVPCNIEKIYQRLNSSTLEILEEDAAQLNNLEVARVLIKTKKPVVITDFSRIQELGRFVLVENNNTCAGGIITAI